MNADVALNLILQNLNAPARDRLAGTISLDEEVFHVEGLQFSLLCIIGII
jgi:hypothetical protein